MDFDSNSNYFVDDCVADTPRCTCTGFAVLEQEDS